MLEATRRSLAETGYRYDVDPDSIASARQLGIKTDIDESSRHRQSISGALAQRHLCTGEGKFSAGNNPFDGDTDDDSFDRNTK